MKKFLYQLCTGDSLEFVFVIATAPDEAVLIATEKTANEGEVYHFDEDDIAGFLPVSSSLTVGVWEYMRFRDAVAI